MNNNIAYDNMPQNYSNSNYQRQNYQNEKTHHEVKNTGIIDSKKLENNDLWRQRLSQNPDLFNRVIDREDENMFKEHFNNLKKKESKFECF